MENETPMRGDRRGFLRRIAIGIVLLPPALLLIVNLWLASPLGCGWLAGRLQARTGLEAHVSSASVTPWDGIILKQVEVRQPAPLRVALREPLARIRRIQLEPVWRSWLRGRRELQSVTLDSPQLVVPLELLANLAASHAPKTTAPPAVAAVPPDATTPPPSNNITPSPTAQDAPKTVPAAPAITLPPTGWLRLTNASFTLLSASSGKHWLQISSVSGAIPISGSPAQSGLHIGAIRAAECDVLTDARLSLDWTAPLLSLKPVEIRVHEFKLLLAGKLGALGGLPLQIEVQLPEQKPAPVALPGDGLAEAQSVTANARFRGFLMAPATWQGELVAEALFPKARIAGNDAAFDRGSAVTVLRGGMLSCVDARLIGDDLSLLGNATILADGRCAGVLRLVAPPDHASAITSRVFPQMPQPPYLTPLSTPQRAAFDLEAFGNIRQIFLRPGRDGPVMELKPAINTEPRMNTDGN
jgi:hypothetical protein